MANDKELVYNSRTQSQKNSYQSYVTDKNGNKEVKICSPFADKKSRITSFFALFTTISVVATYILLGSLLYLWNQAWVLFLLIPVVPSLVDAILRKNPYEFAYPVFIAFLYLLICVWILNFKMFHPLWVMFLTVPIYYPTIRLFRKSDAVIINGERKEDDDDDD